ncbi:MAG: glycoside hydrolase family 16 protein [Flavobacteriaceae bacterium]|nr:glycoside hydrolase family 16 protein [Flavobacteriaceae bacterium]
MFRRIFYFIILINLSLLLSCRGDKKVAIITNEYKLVWADEFDYTGKPDPAKWGYEIGFIRNSEKQYYTDSLKNARVEKGNLIIEAHKEKIANKDFKSNKFKERSWLHYIPKTDTAQYTSASLTTKGIAEWTYGKIEVKAKLPEGVGQWPAIWMLGENKKEVGWPKCGEIDIMEHVGFNKDTVFGSIHSESYNHIKRTQKTNGVFIDQPYDKFHVYSIEWTPEKIDFLLDDVVYLHIDNEHKTTNEWPFDQNFCLKLNNAIGGMWGAQKGIDDSVFPQKMVIDYVKVYQLK